MTDADRSFTCALCGATFRSDWSEEEALADCCRFFGDLPMQDLDVVCDACWEQVRPDRNPEQYLSELRKYGHADR